MQGDVMLNTVIKMVFIEVMTFEQHLKGGKGITHAHSWGKESLVVGAALTKAQKQEFKLISLKNSKEAERKEMEWARERTVVNETRKIMK